MLSWRLDGPAAERPGRLTSCSGFSAPSSNRAARSGLRRSPWRFRTKLLEAVWDSLIKLDEDDLIEFRDGRVEIAYPFSAAPTPFVVRLAGGQERYACCAIDALGVGPMLGQRVHVRSQCHHCGTPLEFVVTRDGPGPEPQEVMVWVGKRWEGERRIATSL